MQKIRSIFARTCRRFGREKAGNVAIIFAVAMIPMAFATLGVVQYSLAISAQTKLNAIADAAALQAVSTSAVQAYQASGTTGQTNATNMFNAQAGQVSGVTVNSLTVNVVPTAGNGSTPGSLTATVSYSATLTDIAPTVLGTNFTTVRGSAVASSQLATYSNFYLLLDGSPSMGIGNSAANIAMMQSQNGCAFACHSPSATAANYPGFSPTPVQPNSVLRIGALQTATSQLISTAINKQTVSNQFKIGVYSFANTVTTISNLTTNLSQIQTDINNLVLPTSNLGTQIADAVDYLSRNVVPSGAGTGTQANPYKYVFIVTDGVEDYAFNYTPGRYDTLPSPAGYWYGVPYSSVMDTTPCRTLKNNGITVAVMYTNYDTVSDQRYTDLVQPFVGNIASTLQSCASPGFFFQADNATDINIAMQQMFAAAVAKSAHLSQ